MVEEDIKLQLSLNHDVEVFMDPLLYQYSVGGIVFLIGMIYAYKQGYVGTTGKGLTNTLIVCGGFLFFLGLQSYLQYAPMSEQPVVKYTGDASASQTGMLGTNLDYIVMFGYFLSMLLVGVWFGRGQSSTKDFFFGMIKCTHSLSIRT